MDAYLKKITTEEVIKELLRELATRERVYPEWIAATKISNDTAKYRVACMKKAIAIVSDTIPKQTKLL